MKMSEELDNKMLIEGRRDAVVRNHGQAGFLFFFFKWKKNRSLTKTLQNVTISDKVATAPIAEDLIFIGLEIFVSDLADWNKPIISFDLFYEPISSLVIRSANQFKLYEIAGVGGVLHVERIGVMVSCMGVMMATNRVTEISVTGRHLGLLQNLLPAMLLHGYKEGRGAMTDEKVLNKLGKAMDWNSYSVHRVTLRSVCCLGGLLLIRSLCWLWCVNLACSTDKLIV
ncbi:hypothetical protein POTOM_014166 [Populus tomentosa]|uniref:Uncharacterized protein n=1 Tax=Populus tomentosa TaxID=118781 RepID=A0A8X8A666_POPTO|nr:hypothetical protein POTOM_014166 [Populus tomentosa]